MAVSTKTMRKHIFLHPMDKNRQAAAVKSTLLQGKNKFSDKLEGSLLDVNNMKVINDRYLIVNGYLSMEVIADFVVFSPQVGQQIEGVINKKSKSHLGCLVMDTFNASLDIPASFGFEPQVGNSCTFVVTEVVIDAEILFLRGTLSSLTSYEDNTEDFEKTENMLIDEHMRAGNRSRLETENDWAADESQIEKLDIDYERAIGGLHEDKTIGGLHEDTTVDDSSKKKTKKSPNKVKK